MSPPAVASCLRGIVELELLPPDGRLLFPGCERHFGHLSAGDFLDRSFKLGDRLAHFVVDMTRQCGFPFSTRRHAPIRRGGLLDLSVVTRALNIGKCC
jgi:hypothetical protein